jgi:D-glycero-D-manno-heptose 1,7-bisphosphate phosphatase
VRRAAFLDRDGVLNALVPDPLSGAAESPLRLEDVVLLPGAAQAAAGLRAAGYVLVVVSNQPAAAKGLVAPGQLEAVHARVLELMELAGAPVDDDRVCLHHPDAVVRDLAGPCRCRKPEPGMLIDAAAELGLDLQRSWMIGDTDSDVGAGAAAGCRTVLIEHGPSSHKRIGDVSPDLRARDLEQAMEKVAVAEVG